MRDGKGVYATIKFKIPDQPNKGLGYWICPDGSQDHAYNVIMKDIRVFPESRHSLPYGAKDVAGTKTET